MPRVSKEIAIISNVRLSRTFRERKKMKKIRIPHTCDWPPPFELFHSSPYVGRFTLQSYTFVCIVWRMACEDTKGSSSSMIGNGCVFFSYMFFLNVYEHVLWYYATRQTHTLLFLNGKPKFILQKCREIRVYMNGSLMASTSCIYDTSVSTSA